MKITPHTKLENLKQILDSANSPVLLISADGSGLSRINEYINAYPNWTIQQLADLKKFDNYYIEVGGEIIYSSKPSQEDNSSATPC